MAGGGARDWRGKQVRGVVGDEVGGSRRLCC